MPLAIGDAELQAMQRVAMGEPDPDIVVSEARIRAAQLGADVAALDELIDDSLLFTGPDGRLATKTADLEAHRSGAIRFREHEPIALHVRRAGPDVAISRLEARLTVLVAGEPVSGTYCYTRVWKKAHDEKWRVVGGHVSAIPPE